MKVAITGANGFLGSYLVKECLQQNMEVYALIRSGANTSLLPENVNLHVVEIDYQKKLIDQFSNLKFTSGQLDFFIHNAGMTVSLKNEEYYRVNVGLTTTICDSINESNLLNSEGLFVYTSSYAAHGPANTGKPVSHYGRSKLKAEQVIQEKFPNHLLVRPTAIYGAGDQAFLPLIKWAKMGLYPITSRTQRMSMIHAADLARMVVLDMQVERGTLHYNDGETYLHDDFVEIFKVLFKKNVWKLPLPKWLAKFSMGCSDIWHKLINKRPSITLEKFSEISQDWDLHNTKLKHSRIESKISLKEGFKDSLEYYLKNKLI